MKHTFLLKLLLAAALTAALAPSSQADTPALSFTGGTGLQVNGDGNVGWSFTLTSTLQVTSLGYYDDGADGLQTAHPIGIFSGTGSLLTSATVPAGTAAPLISGFRYVSISALTLTPGTYVVDASVTALNDTFYARASTITTAAGITYLAGRASGGTGLVFPTTNLFPVANGYFGPNFQVAGATASVPDTGSTLALLGLGLGGLALARAKLRLA